MSIEILGGYVMKKRKWTKEEVDSWMRKHDALIYYNPLDKNLFVRKRFSFGWTMNLGNPMSYVTVVGIIAVLFLLIKIMG